MPLNVNVNGKVELRLRLLLFFSFCHGCCYVPHLLSYVTLLAPEPEPELTWLG